MKKILLFLFIAICSWTAQAETIFVTDSWRFTLRSKENNRSKIIKMLAPGTPLTVISRNKNGYTKVKLKDGTVGYVLTTHTKDKPIYRWYLKLANKELDALKAENATIKARY